MYCMHHIMYRHKHKYIYAYTCITYLFISNAKVRVGPVGIGEVEEVEDVECYG